MAVHFIEDRNCYRLVNLEIDYAKKGKKTFEYRFSLEGIFKQTKEDINNALCILEVSAIDKLSTYWAKIKQE